MSERLNTEFVPKPLPAEPTSPTWRRAVTGLPGMTALVLLLGVLAGVLWGLATPLTEYTISDAGTASTTERGLSRVVAPVIWFSIIALVLGVLAGILLWQPGRRLRWGVVPWALVTVGVAELIMWGIGTVLGPGPLHPRITAGAAGDVIPAALELGSRVPLLMGPVGVSLVLVSLACFGPEPPSQEPDVDERWAPPQAPAQPVQ